MSPCFLEPLSEIEFLIEFINVFHSVHWIVCNLGMLFDEKHDGKIKRSAEERQNYSEHSGNSAICTIFLDDCTSHRLTSCLIKKTYIRQMSNADPDPLW